MMRLFRLTLNVVALGLLAGCASTTPPAIPVLPANVVGARPPSAVATPSPNGFDASKIPQSEWEQPFVLEAGPRIVTGPAPTLRPVSSRPALFDGVLRKSELDEAPRPKLRQAPVYPFELYRGGVTGSATVAVVVGVDGAVTQPAVIQASDVRFASAARHAVANWQFTPGTKNGIAAACVLVIAIEFRLLPDE